MSREIILDTETTGLDPAKGHRLIEIGCVEIINKVSLGKEFHVRINPERDISIGAFRVHGISYQDLIDCPKFHEIAPSFYEFIGDSNIVAHNASFDINFLNFELGKLAYPPIPQTRVIDTLLLARKAFPGEPANLDALCKRFKIDLSGREKHGALIDAKLLAEVYINLLGGPQIALSLGNSNANTINNSQKERIYREARNFPLTLEEEEMHLNFIKEKIKSPLWLQEE